MRRRIGCRTGRMSVCTFSGSYYDQMPWAEQACTAEIAVPAGCPVHFVTGAQPDPSSITAARVESDGTLTPLAATATPVDTVAQTFTLPDEFSCDCTPTQTNLQFQRFAVAVPGSNAGDFIAIQFAGLEGSAVEVEVTAAAPCPAAEWPTDYDVGLACDHCPMPPADSQGSQSSPGGCDAGGAPSLCFGGLALLALARRRRRPTPRR
jgi:uncharacterized protein (TIGR03382 family)